MVNCIATGSRDAFEEVLGAMARAGLLQLSDEVFQKDGKQIPYRKANLTHAGHAVDEKTLVDFVMKDMASTSGKRKRKKSTVSAGRRRSAKTNDAACPKSSAKVCKVLQVARTTDRENVVYIPRIEGYSVLLSVSDANGFLSSLRKQA